jgi:hypothetical protein
MRHYQLHVIPKAELAVIRVNDSSKTVALIEAVGPLATIVARGEDPGTILCYRKDLEDWQTTASRMKLRTMVSQKSPIGGWDGIDVTSAPTPGGAQWFHEKPVAQEYVYLVARI